MNINFSKNYTGDSRKKYNFPSEGLPQSKKDEKDYFLKGAQAIVAKYINNVCELPYDNWNRRRSLNIIKRYAEGRQSISKYQDTLIGKKDKTGCRRKNTWNIDWTTLDILPKKLGDVLSYMLKINYEVVSSAIDPQATLSRETLIAASKLMTDERIKNFADELNNLSGGQAVSPDGELIGQMADLPFQNEQQVDMAAKVGTFLLEMESAMQILLNKTNEDSTSKIIDKMLKRDLIYYNMAAKYAYCVGDSVLEDHIDLDKLILPWSKYPDHRKDTYAGFTDTTTIAEIVKLNRFSDEEIIAIAKKYNDTGNNVNNRLNNFDNDVYQCQDQGLGLTVLHSIQVDIAKTWWIGNKNLKQTSVTRKKDGGLSLNNVDDNYDLSESQKSKGKELKNYTWQTVYKSTLIIGTDFCYDYGQDNNIQYSKNEEGKMCAKIPISVYKIDGPSMAERCIGFMDDANLALFKKRMIIKNVITGPGIKVNKAAFENVVIDNKRYNPIDLIGMFTDEGVLIVDDKNPFGGPNQSGSRPIDTIPSDVFQRLLGCRNEIEYNLQMIDLITGINPSFSAKQPESETGLGVTKIALSATENSVYQLIDAFEELSNHSNRVKCDKWKIIAEHMDDKKRDNFATRSLKWIRIDKSMAWHDYGITMEVGVSETEKLQLMQRANQLADLRRQSGTGGIKPSDEMLIGEMVRQGNIKQARLMLTQIEEFREQQDEAKTQKRYQENAQLQQQSNEQASANQQQAIQTEGQVEAQKDQRKFQYDLALQQQKSENEKKLTAIQNIFGWNGELYKKTVK